MHLRPRAEGLLVPLEELRPRLVRLRPPLEAGVGAELCGGARVEGGDLRGEPGDDTGLELVAGGLLEEALLRLREHDRLPHLERVAAHVVGDPALLIQLDPLQQRQRPRRLLEALARSARPVRVGALLHGGGVAERGGEVEQHTRALELQVVLACRRDLAFRVLLARLGSRVLLARLRRMPSVPPGEPDPAVRVVDRRSEAGPQVREQTIVPREQAHRVLRALLRQGRRAAPLPKCVHLGKGVAMLVGLLERVALLDEAVQRTLQVHALGLLQRQVEHSAGR
mmetsp:Transcript_19899/g.50326  ORF Transcript_19899/g.50326 Transcript_19899/m.50326 type:complete len:282 (+) Transcript_19899:1481-2326(+)